MEENDVPHEFEPAPSYVLASIIKARIKDVHVGDVKKALLSDGPRTTGVSV